jgi:hypothetical protein
LDVAIEHPVDPPLPNPERQRIQRLVLAASRPESVAEPVIRRAPIDTPSRRIGDRSDEKLVIVRGARNSSDRTTFRKALTGSATQWRNGGQVMFSIGTKVRFIEPFRPEAVAPGAVGVVVGIEPLPTVIGPPQRLRARFGDYISPWLIRGQLEAVD